MKSKRGRAANTHRVRTAGGSRGVQTEHRDPIRIVPLHAAAVPVAAPARLTYRGGPLLRAVEVFTIFWGGDWKKAPQSAMVGQINQFFDDILTSPLLDDLAEYNVAKYVIAHGKRTGTTTITAPPLASSVT